MTKHHMPTTCLLLALAAFATQLNLISPPGAAAIGSTPVKITNPEDVAKAEGLGQPFQTSITCTGPAPAQSCEGVKAVPASKRWVIELVTYQCFAGGTDIFLVSLQTTVAGTTVFHILSIPDRHLDGDAQGIYTQAQAVRVYADAASTIVFGASAVVTSGNPPHCEVTLSGQSVTVP